MVTVAIVGAGIAGLVCGRSLQAAGHTVFWLEKSRGVGGRLATRRIEGSGFVDQGLRYWAPDCAELQTLTTELIQQGIIHPWMAQGFVWDREELRPQAGAIYCSERGSNAIAKYLARSCDIRRQHRVTQLVKTASGWQLVAATSAGDITVSADAVVLAIPAPQVLPLLQPLDAQTDGVAVDYRPCLSLMATYDTLPELPPLEHLRGWYIASKHPVLSWLSLDSSKPKQHPGINALLFQSQADFAAQYFSQLDAISSDGATAALQQATVSQMVKAAATIVPGLAAPTDYRLHRWRYSTVRHPYPKTMLMTKWPSLIGGGDWCSPNSVTNLEAAYRSGLAAAKRLTQQL